MLMKVLFNVGLGKCVLVMVTNLMEEIFSLHEHHQSHYNDLITFNGHDPSSGLSLMDEIFSLHEHHQSHLITFNGHRFLLFFLVNLLNLENERERVHLFLKDVLILSSRLILSWQQISLWPLRPERQSAKFAVS